MVFFRYKTANGRSANFKQAINLPLGIIIFYPSVNMSKHVQELCSNVASHYVKPFWMYGVFSPYVGDIFTDGEKNL